MSIASSRLPLLGGLALLLALALLASAGARDRDERGREEETPAAPTERLPRTETGSTPFLPLPDERFGDEKAARRAIDQALHYLAIQQSAEPDGSFPPTGAKRGHGAPVAITALGALAYLSAGNGLDRGPEGRPLSRAIGYLLSQVKRESTSQQRGYISADRDGRSRTHGHGFATLALAEAFSVSPTSARGARILQALELAVDRIEDSQGTEGGWYYTPTRSLQHEGSVTITMVQALRAAKGAGVEVDPRVIARAVDYVQRSQRDDGAFRYAIGSDQVTIALTAAAISTLNATGTYHGSSIAQGYDYIQRELRARENAPESPGVLETGVVHFAFYERLYLAQAFWQNADRSVFFDWAKEERKQILREQRRDGSWTGSDYGDCYATAVNVLFLALPDRLLPIFQR
jgi:hypothetical protein